MSGTPTPPPGGADQTPPAPTAPYGTPPEGPDAGPPPAPGDVPTVDWRRLSPRMLLIHPVRELIRFIPAIAVLFFAGSSGHGNREWWSLIGVAVAVLLGIWRWYTTSFRITDRMVQIKHGILQRQTVTAQLNRVRTVDVTSPALHRLLGLSEVRVGTGAGEKELRLNGLGTAEATRLRDELLHHRPGTAAPDPAVAPPGGAAPGAPGTAGQESPVGTAPAAGPIAPAGQGPDRRPGAAASYAPDEVLYRIRMGWIRYAPFSPAGLITALAVVGVGGKIFGNGVDPERVPLLNTLLHDLGRLGVLTLVLLGIAVFVVVATVLALVGYLLSYYNFSLTRNTAGGSLHVSRGLLTTRNTSLEIRRLRGVEVRRHLPLRWVGGAQLQAITTGLKHKDRESSSILAPSSPLDVIERTGEQVLLTPGLWSVQLSPHGPRATRRRYTRGIVGGLIVWILLVVLALLVHSAWPAPFGLLILVASLLLARDRAGALAHAVTDRFLLSRAGSVTRSTVAVERRGAVGVLIRRSFFQRRAGVSSVGMATAAGRQLYVVTDVTADEGVELAGQLLPDGCLTPFLASPDHAGDVRGTTAAPSASMPDQPDQPARPAGDVGDVTPASGPHDSDEMSPSSPAPRT